MKAIALPLLIFFSLISFSAKADPLNPCQVDIDASFPADVRTALLASLAFLEGIQGNGGSSFHQQIFGTGVDGASYCKFIQDRITSFYYADFSDSSLYAENHFGYMIIGDLFLKDNIFDQASAILHEARHTEGWPHVNCPVPFLDLNGQPILGPLSGDPLAGTLSCDTETLSSYGLEVIWARNMQKYCTNCGANIKAFAATNEKNLILRIINPDAATAIEADQ